MIISGAIIPVGVKNKNGWGILDSEIQNVINTLKGKPITVCSRNGGAHECDFDPKAEIGNVKDVWYDPFAKKIRAMAAVTDSVAQRKIAEGTWKPNWSVRLAAKDKDGWAENAMGKNITIVPEGAWPDANFDVLAAKDDGYEINLLASFSVENAPAPSEPSNPNTHTVIGTIEYVSHNDINTAISNTSGNFTSSTWPVDNSISPDKSTTDKDDKSLIGGNKMVEEIKKEKEIDPEVVAALQAKDDVIADLQKKLEEKVAAPVEDKQDAEIVSDDDKIASKAKEIADQQIAAYKAGLEREIAINEYVAAAKAHGVEAKTEMFEGLNAQQIGVFTAGMKSIKAPEKEDDKLAGLKYPTSTPEETGSLSVGIPKIGANGEVTWITSV